MVYGNYNTLNLLWVPFIEFIAVEDIDDNIHNYRKHEIFHYMYLIHKQIIM